MNLRLSSPSVESRIQKYKDTLNSSPVQRDSLEPIDYKTMASSSRLGSCLEQFGLAVVVDGKGILFNFATS